MSLSLRGNEKTEYSSILMYKCWKEHSASTTEEFILHLILSLVPMRSRDFSSDASGAVFMVVQYVLYIHSHYLEENSLLTLLTLCEVATLVLVYIGVLLLTALGITRIFDEVFNNIHFFRLITIIGYSFIPLLLGALLGSWTGLGIRVAGAVSMAQSLMKLPKDPFNGAILGCCMAAVSWKLHTILPS